MAAFPIGTKVRVKPGQYTAPPCGSSVAQPECRALLGRVGTVQGVAGWTDVGAYDWNALRLPLYRVEVPRLPSDEPDGHELHEIGEDWLERI